MSNDNWQTCVVDPDYEINMTYPFELRRRTKTRILIETIHDGYPYVHLNRKYMSKTKIVMEQIAANNPIYQFMVEHNAPPDLLKKYKNELYLNMINEIAESIEE